MIMDDLYWDVLSSDYLHLLSIENLSLVIENLSLVMCRTTT